MSRAVLLGPQRREITLPGELARLGLTGKVAAITAGWQEREAEEEELQEALGFRAVNLRLHARCEEVFAGDPALFEAHRERQDRVRLLQEVYRMRLGSLLDSTRALFDHSGPAELLQPEREASIAAIRSLDDHHLARLQSVHAEFDARMRLAERPLIAAHRAEIEAKLEQCQAVAIAGGHVAVLLNRLRLFQLGKLLSKRTVVAWSAGAMVLCERVVLFHDRPPEGPGNAELLDAGLGLVPGIVALPHAQQRLRTDDLQRMMILATRHRPARCVALESGARLEWDGQQWLASDRTTEIASDGRIVPFANAGGAEVESVAFGAPTPC